MKERTEVIVLVAVSLLSSLLLYLPFALNVDAVLGVKLPVTGMQVLQRYYDGPLYVVVSKTFYAPTSPLYSLFLARTVLCRALAWISGCNLALLAGIFALRSDACCESCDISSSGRRFLLLHSEVQTRTRSFFLGAFVPLLSAPVVPLPEHWRIGTTLHPAHAADALFLKEG